MENLLVPRNIKGRKDKLKQMNIRLLSQEVITEHLYLDESFMDIDPKFIKVKKVNNHVWLKGEKWTEIPEWLKYVEIEGELICSYNKLTTLKNCPQKIGGDLYCHDNLLISLEGCPKINNGNLYCYNNKIKLELPGYVKLKGCFYNQSI